MDNDGLAAFSCAHVAGHRVLIVTETFGEKRRHSRRRK
jgi:hypothetical protein